ncbi:MAG TPA: response regulator transcription factor [Anaerolineales bacterium]|nr:response regulator transcription factor [Anaerolineales bacterium]
MDQTVLIIDDDADLLQLASLLFKKAGAQVITAHDGLEGISKFFTHHPDLVVLDVMMPGNNGFDICTRIRQVSETPLIFLTAMNKEREMLQGLAAGADDFLTKPFNPEILLARARAILRRTQRANGSNGSNGSTGHNGHNGSNGQNGSPGGNGNGQTGSFTYNDGYLSIDIERHEVLLRGRRVKLTPIEFRLLVYLARNAGKMLTFDKILCNVWGSEYQGSMDYVHVYVSHLRRKIEDGNEKSRYILTVHGEGYIFEKQELVYKS